jgi:DNA-binding winged helix-turn-helix (wHTH) protein/TolB-like protein
MDAATQPIRIGEHTFDPGTGELTGPAGRTRLRPQQAALLALLAGRAGELVTRDELRAHLWPETQVEFDQGLDHGLRQLRLALGDSVEAPRYIETLPKRGYRLIAAVRPVPPPPEGDVAPPVLEPRRVSRRVALAGVATGVAALGLWVWAAVRPGRPLAAPPQLLAVLELDAPAGSDERRASAVLAEALTTELTRLGAGRVGVIGPSTTRRYDGTATPAERIRAELGVAHVVSGTLRRAGDSLHVFAQLVRTADLRHVWAQRYTVPAAADPGALARRMAGEVSARLREGG